MKLLPTIKDSRGRESRTLLFVTAALCVLLVKFALAGLALLGQKFPTMTGLEFAGAFGAVLAAWLGREWTDKVGSTKGGLLK